MKAVRTSGKMMLRGAIWGTTVVLLALLTTAGYKIGETWALNNADDVLEIAAMSPALETGRTPETAPLFRLRFTEPIKASLVNEYFFSLVRDDSSLRIPLRIAWDEPTRTVRLAPRSPLEPDAEYVLEVNPDLVSTGNHRLAGPFARRFKVSKNSF